MEFPDELNSILARQKKINNSDIRPDFGDDPFGLQTVGTFGNDSSKAVMLDDVADNFADTDVVIDDCKTDGHSTTPSHLPYSSGRVILSAGKVTMNRVSLPLSTATEPDSISLRFLTCDRPRPVDILPVWGQNLVE